MREKKLATRISKPHFLTDGDVIAGVGEYDVVKRGTAPATELAPGMQPQEVSHREAALARRRGRSLVGGPPVGGAGAGSGLLPETSPTKQDTAHQQQVHQFHQYPASVAAPPSIIAPSSVGPAPFATREFTSPYLLLDVRDPDEYDRCHIISGVHSTFGYSNNVLRDIRLNRYILEFGIIEN